jgi:hypothetical protein
MTMPGFTAGASLGKPSHSYYMAGSYHRANGAVQAAFIRRPGCFLKCLQDNGDDPFAEENCACICHGHPGRTCFLQ